MKNTIDGPTTRNNERPADRPPRRGFSTRSKVVAGIAALALATAGGATLVSLGSGGDEYQTVSYAGQNPFMPPVGTDQPEVTPVQGAGGQQSGATTGLYAQNPDQLACDAAALMDNLQADPAKAAAWAQVLGLSPPGIPAFVDSLTPVVLRADTAVIDHGYRNGTFVATPAVLAPGTAVFINSYGEPTVKCYSGNPLTKGTNSDPSVTVIAPAGSQIATNTFVNQVTGAAITVPGKPDPKPNPGPNPDGKPDPDLVKRVKEALEARAKAEGAKERAADAATAARIADTGLRETQQRLTDLRAEQLRLIAIANDLTKPLAERLAAQAQLNDQSPTGLSNRIINAQKDVGAAARNKDKADADKATADEEAAKLDREAREKEKEAGLPSPPAKQPAKPGQPGQVKLADEQAGGEQPVEQLERDQQVEQGQQFEQDQQPEEGQQVEQDQQPEEDQQVEQDQQPEEDQQPEQDQQPEEDQPAGGNNQ